MPHGAFVCVRVCVRRWQMENSHKQRCKSFCFGNTINIYVETFIDGCSGDLGTFMFGLAATASHIPHNFGITAAAAAAHTPKTSFESQKHPRTIQRNSSGKTAAAATRTSGHPHRRNACVPCSGVLQFNHIPKGNLAQQMLPVYFIFPSILYTYIGASTTLRTPSTLKYSEETADKTSRAGGSVSQLSTLSSPVF